MNEPPALQAERTAFAWTRTVLLIAAVATLIARTADSGVERGVAIALSGAGLALAVGTAMRRRYGIASGDPIGEPPGRTVGGLLAAVASLIAAAVVVIL
jgi:hypothetical protein